MLKVVYRYLNIKRKERMQIFLMMVSGFFLGVFISTYGVVVESLFLNLIGSELKKAILIAGILGIFSTFIFSYLQNLIRFSILTISACVLIFFITILVYLAYHFGPLNLQKSVIFIGFCLLGPMSAILLLVYWGLFGRLFDFKQSKRIIGWIDTGQLLAIILASILIPFTGAIFVTTDNYLIVSIVAVFLSTVIFLFITTKYDLSYEVTVSNYVKADKPSRNPIKDSYTKLLSIFMIISMILLVYCQFIFQELLIVQYPEQMEMTNFIAYFNATLYILSFVMQTFIFNRLTISHGIKYALFILPVVVGVMTICALVTGLAFGFTPELAPNAFVFLFLFVSLTRLFNGLLRDSLETPIFKLLFIPIDSRFRFSIQSHVEGFVSESGRLMAGILIFSLSLIPFYSSVWLLTSILVLVSLYFVVIGKLTTGYKTQIQSKLESVTGLVRERFEIGYTTIINRLGELLKIERPSTAVFSYKLLEKYRPLEMNVWVNRLVNNSKDETRKYAQRKLNELKGVSVSEQYVVLLDENRQNGGDGKVLLSRSEVETILSNGGEISKIRITKLARSKNPIDRKYAAELLMHREVEESNSLLVELLNDPDLEVRKTAFVTSTKRYNGEIILTLIDNLRSPVFSHYSMNSLVLIGEDALSWLDNSFYRTGMNYITLIRIIQVIGRIGGNGQKLLWNKIDYPDKLLLSIVLKALGDCSFKAKPNQVSRIVYEIENDIARISWNYRAILELDNNNIDLIIIEALQSEISKDIDHIYMLLSMIYDTRSIQLVKENIESLTNEGVAFAIELLNAFLSDHLKKRIIPILDDISMNEKINQLEAYFPQIKLEKKIILKLLINRDFTQSNRWTKACVLYKIGERKYPDFSIDLIAHLFNQDVLIYETAAWALYQISPSEYEINAKRLPVEVYKSLNGILKKEHLKDGVLHFDKIVFLKQVEMFYGISGLSLSYLADISKEEFILAGESLELDEKLNPFFYLIYSGKFDLFRQGKRHATFVSGQFIGEMLSQVGFARTNVLLATEDSLIIKINKDLFYELLIDEIKMAGKVLEYV